MVASKPKAGNSADADLPAEILQPLKAGEGEMHYIAETSDGSQPTP